MAAAGFALAISAPFAQAQGVQITGDPRFLPAENDFLLDLPPMLIEDVSLVLLQRARVTFTEIAAESGNDSTLAVIGLGQMTETRDFGFPRGIMRFRDDEQLTGVFAPGVLDGALQFIGSDGAVVRPGDPGFAVFADGAPGGVFTTFYLVYDDVWGNAGLDEDFDDYVIRVDIDPLD